MTVGRRHYAGVDEGPVRSFLDGLSTVRNGSRIGVAGERDSTADRGQLGFDFFAGMSLFLIMVGFVFNFAPVMFDPFTTGQGGEMTMADRTAAAISEDLLADTGTAPNILNDTCVEEFFDADGDTADCRFRKDADDLTAAVGVGSKVKLNVTIEDSDEVVELNSVTLSAGPTPTSTASTTVSRRIVFLDGEEETLIVRVW